MDHCITVKSYKNMYYKERNFVWDLLKFEYKIIFLNSLSLQHVDTDFFKVKMTDMGPRLLNKGIAHIVLQNYLALKSQLQGILNKT